MNDLIKLIADHWRCDMATATVRLIALGINDVAGAVGIPRELREELLAATENLADQRREW